MPNQKNYYMMKFIIGLFREFPTSTGLLVLLISCHFTGIKDLSASWAKAPEVFWNIVMVYIIFNGFFITFFIHRIEQNRRERATWVSILTSVVVLTVLAKFFAF